MKHLVPTLALALLTTGTLTAQSIVGSWFAKSAGEAKSDVVLTFLPNGTYLMAENGNRKADPTGKNGMERGTYKWNSKTDSFSNKTITDTTGEWGLSDESVKSVSVSGNTLKLGGVKFKKVSSKKSKLVGSWYFKKSDGYALITFLANNTYFMVEDGKSEGGGKKGMERGTYKWKTGSKVLKCTDKVDTNGTWGLSDSSKKKATVSGRKLSLKVSGEGTYKLKKVVK